MPTEALIVHHPRLAEKSVRYREVMLLSILLILFVIQGTVPINSGGERGMAAPTALEGSSHA